MNVLIADDHPNLTELEHLIINDFDTQKHSIYLVNNGLDALHFLHKSGDFSRSPDIDLLFVDERMPRMSGIELLINIKQEKYNVYPIFILLSDADYSNEMIESFHRNGASAVMDRNRFWRRLGEVFSYWDQFIKLPNR